MIFRNNIFEISLQWGQTQLYHYTKTYRLMQWEGRSVGVGVGTHGCGGGSDEMMRAENNLN